MEDCGARQKITNFRQLSAPAVRTRGSRRILRRTSKLWVAGSNPAGRAIFPTERNDAWRLIVGISCTLIWCPPSTAAQTVHCVRSPTYINNLVVILARVDRRQTGKSALESASTYAKYFDYVIKSHPSSYFPRRTWRTHPRFASGQECSPYAGCSGSIPTR